MSKDKDAPTALRKWRTDRKMTQLALASMIGTYSQTISDYESGRKQPSLESAVALEDATDGEIPARLWVDRRAA